MEERKKDRKKERKKKERKKERQKRKKGVDVNFKRKYFTKDFLVKKKSMEFYI